MNASAEDAGSEAREVALRALLSGIVGRDENALTALYDATVSRVYTLALRITGDRHAAEEVVTDVYLQIWRQAEHYDPVRGKVPTWIYTLCRSRALDHLRRRDIADNSPDPHALRPDASMAETDPLDVLIGMELSSALYSALLTLNMSERQLMSLAFFKGLTHQEIALHTGMPLGTVKTVLRKAIQTLKQRLQGSPAQPRERCDVRP